MPAHCELGDAGVRTLSTGRTLTATDIVANREVDKHAKLAAEADRMDESTVQQVRQAWSDTMAVARWIGMVTVAAQQQDAEADPQRRNGRRIRDSQPTTAAPQQADARAYAAAPARPNELDDEQPFSTRRRGCGSLARYHHQQNRERANEERALAQLLGSRPAGRPPKRSAAEIMAEVTRRVRARGTRPGNP